MTKKRRELIGLHCEMHRPDGYSQPFSEMSDVEIVERLEKRASQFEEKAERIRKILNELD